MTERKYGTVDDVFRDETAYEVNVNYTAENPSSVNIPSHAEEEKRYGNRVFRDKVYHHTRRDHRIRNKPFMWQPKGNLMAKALDQIVGAERNDVTLIEEEKRDSNTKPLDSGIDSFITSMMKNYNLTRNELDYAIDRFANHRFGTITMTRIAAEHYREGSSGCFVEAVEFVDEKLRKNQPNKTTAYESRMLAEIPEEERDGLIFEQPGTYKDVREEDDRAQLTNYLLSNSEWDEERHAERADPLHRTGATIPFYGSEVHVNFSEHRMKEHGLDSIISLGKKRKSA